MAHISRIDRAAGAIIGTLIGDALGVGPHWYYDLDELKSDYGSWINNYTAPLPHRYHSGLKPGESSQTGEVVTLLLESVAEMGGYQPSDFTERLDRLLATLDGTPKGGRYTDIAMRELWKARRLGKPWSETGGFADTAEAAIRTPVLAARYKDGFKRFLELAVIDIRLTHRDPFIVGQSAAFGLVVFSLINEVSLGDVPDAIRRWARENDIPFHTLVDWVEGIGPAAYGKFPTSSFIDAVLQPGWSYAAAHDPAIRIEPAQTASRLFGLACTLGFMLPAAYYFASRFENDFEKAVLSAINGGGNNMARASLTGALSGAQVGLSGIPERFITGLYDHGRLVRLAERVAGWKLSSGS